MNSVDIDGDLTVDNITAKDIIGENTTLTGILTQTGDSVLDGKLTVKENVTLEKSITVTETTELNGDVDINASLIVKDISTMTSEGVVVSVKQTNNNDVDIQLENINAENI